MPGARRKRADSVLRSGAARAAGSAGADRRPALHAPTRGGSAESADALPEEHQACDPQESPHRGQGAPGEDQGQDEGRPGEGRGGAGQGGGHVGPFEVDGRQLLLLRPRESRFYSTSTGGRARSAWGAEWALWGRGCGRRAEGWARGSLLSDRAIVSYYDTVSPLDTSVDIRYYGGMIRSFGCSETKRIFDGEESSAFPLAIQDTARKKLRMVDAARHPRDLTQPPGNRFEIRKSGKWRGWCSIRINDQWRILFRWEGGAEEVQIKDPH